MSTAREYIEQARHTPSCAGVYASEYACTCGLLIARQIIDHASGDRTEKFAGRMTPEQEESIDIARRLMERGTPFVVTKIERRDPGVARMAMGGTGGTGGGGSGEAPRHPIAQRAEKLRSRLACGGDGGTLEELAEVVRDLAKAFGA